MSAQRFQAPTTIEALRRIKAELGPDAVVLSSNDVPSGVEIVAIAAADLVTLKPAPAPAPQPAAQEPPASGISQRWANRLAQDNAAPDLPLERPPVSQTAVRRAIRDLPPRDEAELAALYNQRMPQPASRPETTEAPWRSGLAASTTASPVPVRVPFPTPAAPSPAPVQVRTPELPRMPAPLTRRPAAPVPVAAPPMVVAQPAPVPKASAAATIARATAPVPPPQKIQQPSLPPAPAVPDPAVTGLTAQMSEMKAMLSGHLAANMWSSLQQEAPARALLTRRLLNAGLSSQVIAQMLAELPAEDTLDALLVHAHRWVQARLETRDAFALFDQGGVYAFLGPTGVGKTTTVAKIAARCVLRYGRQQVALLTTDTYRIGAQEQLKVFARILGLPVVSLRDSEDLQTQLADLSKRKVVLLDTAGVGQRDTMMLEQLEMIREGCADVHRVLVMSATTSTRTLDDVVEAHQNALGEHNIDAAIVTKMDEGMSLAPAMDCVMRHRLPLLFLANGQRVPEDLFTADAAYLAHRTVSPRGRDAGDTDVSHIPALMADEMSTWTEHLKKP
ncbi:MAG: flagellar biosynthesis protein FlhF [Hydrogenophaga sp.]|uniref:flagellar biosynthesis protein FlhF n=1 Tax=Hydrogenophaga sp. TaxID=1904254 RepID=UPI002615496D|nr:flagellar biosynthesis protein FlhF [Hydrogenophaga sp.]MDM7942392.1 flagellar biosynthesis protein FlhF [Hydrogenophaga sp.]